MGSGARPLGLPGCEVPTEDGVVDDAPAAEPGEQPPGAGAASWRACSGISV